ncbi:unnamed protein product [Clonostachys byssicola]|uniref:Uncharacterized protein n=1 Tax=Clonostachys byssicola TaxID=160290 RepID=A0A9N9XX47_9HYPO|nr:unnamed protein product [Clonostachys byssicola]
MNPPDRRRGGGAHVLRAGPHSHHTTRQRAGSKDKDKEKEKDASMKDGTSATSNSMPTVPPRAAVISPPSPSHDDSLDGSGGVTLSDRKEKDKEANKDKDGGASPTPGSGSGSSNPNRRSMTLKGKQPQQQLRDRDAAAALRDKDERIAHLEKEMGIMEHEFQKELDKLSQNESEMATFWQAKYSALNQQFLRTDTELRLLRTEAEVRELEREELRKGWEVLRRELKQRDDEIRGLRGQVRGLKEFVSTSTRTDDQTSDEVFGEGMTKLGNGLQNWVIVNFRKAKMDLGKADEATMTELGDLVPMFEELVHTSKVHLLQSIVSSILVEMVFDTYYVGMSKEQRNSFREMEQLLLSFTAADEAVNQWRASTLSLIRREAPHRLSEETSACVEQVISRINRLLDAITTQTSSSSSSSSTTATNNTSENRDNALRVLVNNSIELARLLAVQKAILRVHTPTIVPHQRTLFEPSTMEDIGGEDEDTLAERDISCVAFPGLIKQGDESGGHLQYRNVITKARVLCSPEE